MPEYKTSRDWLIDEVNYLIDQQKGYINALKDHADKTDDEELRRNLLDFRADHEAHRDRLQKYLGTLKAGHLPVGLGEALGVSLGGGGVIMESARDTDYSSLFREAVVEQALIGAYNVLIQVAEVLGEPELERICRQNMESDKRHLGYIQSCFVEQVTTFVGSIPPYEAAA